MGLFPGISTGSSPRYIDIFTSDEDFDTLDLSENVCPRWKYYVDEAHKQPEYTEHLNLVSYPLAADLAFLRNGRVDLEIDHFRDCLMTHVCHQHELPANMTETLIERVNNEADWRRIADYSYPNTTAAVRAGAGLLFKDIRNVISDDKHPFHYYGTHDSMLIYLMLGMEIWDGNWPPYATHMSFEQFELQGEMYFRVLFNWKAQLLPWCQNKYNCPLSTAQAYLDTLIINDMSECNVQYDI